MDRYAVIDDGPDAYIIALMKNIMVHLAVALVAIGVAGCAADPGGRDSALKALREADRSLQDAIAAKDLDRITSFYAGDATLHPTAKPGIAGKDGIRSEWAAILRIPDFASKSDVRTVDVSASGDLGYTAGTYTATLRGEDGAIVSEPGKYLTVWKKQQDRSWKVAIETYNTDIPPPDHK